MLRSRLCVSNNLSELAIIFFRVLNAVRRLVLTLFKDKITILCQYSNPAFEKLLVMGETFSASTSVTNEAVSPPF